MHQVSNSQYFQCPYKGNQTRKHNQVRFKAISLSQWQVSQQSNNNNNHHTVYDKFTQVLSTKSDTGIQLKQLSSENWPPKADMYLVRSDGHSCSREMVRGSGKLTFAYPSTHQHLLVWKNRPQSVLVLKKLGQDLKNQCLQIVEFLGKEENMRVVVEPDVFRELNDKQPDLDFLHTFSEQGQLAEIIDFVVCLGGDGVILHASNLFQSSAPPIIAFNFGSLGFLTNHDFNDFKQDIKDVIYGCEMLRECSFDEGQQLGIHVALRMRLQCDLYREGKWCSSYNVLNEVVVDRGSAPFLTNVEVYEQGKYVTNVQADGVMLATPTGSTAYSVSAGGSMVHPNVSAILFTPICPHSLSFRPIILPDYADIELKIPNDARSTAWMSFDGKNRQELHRGDCLRVRMSQRPVPTINKTDLTNDWINSLERCFQWNNRIVQKAFQ
eukprot:TRINITY_DN23575_c0_g2_i9.p1 TRINITY_DN23575_c0_g2~~TRINITY_DN23575_c0_g2_i9.p1  ORF type:complete len:438 (+),score=38.63 TRINITY_DN23575_c0_g2_i9:168-1481(+)